MVKMTQADGRRSGMAPYMYDAIPDPGAMQEPVPDYTPCHVESPAHGHRQSLVNIDSGAGELVGDLRHLKGALSPLPVNPAITNTAGGQLNNQRAWTVNLGSDAVACLDVSRGDLDTQRRGNAGDNSPQVLGRILLDLE